MAAATTKKGEPLPRVWPEGVGGMPGRAYLGRSYSAGAQGELGEENLTARRACPQQQLTGIAMHNVLPQETISLINIRCCISISIFKKTFFTLEIVMEINRK